MRGVLESRADGDNSRELPLTLTLSPEYRGEGNDPRNADSPDRPQAPADPRAPDAPTPPKAEVVRFEAVDVFVDSGDKPLAAYQVELTAKAGDALLAGLEGGEHAAFRPAPYYDPRALLNNKVIVAAFSTAADLPHGRTRVARLMVQVSGPAEPRFAATLTTAASADGKPIPAAVTASPAAGVPVPDGPPLKLSVPSPTSNPSEGAVP